MDKAIGARGAIVALHGLDNLEATPVPPVQLSSGPNNQQQVRLIMFDQHHGRHSGVHFANAAAGDDDVAACKRHLPHHEAVQRLATGALAGKKCRGLGIHASYNSNSFEHKRPAFYANTNASLTCE
jgi:hypothetical protein